MGDKSHLVPAHFIDALFSRVALVAFEEIHKNHDSCDPILFEVMAHSHCTGMGLGQVQGTGPEQ